MKKSVIGEIVFYTLLITITLITGFFIYEKYNSYKENVNKKSEEISHDTTNLLAIFTDRKDFRIPFFVVSQSSFFSYSDVNDQLLSLPNWVVDWHEKLPDRFIYYMKKYNGNLFLVDSTNSLKEDILDMVYIDNYFYYNFDEVYTKLGKKGLNETLKLINLKKDVYPIDYSENIFKEETLNSLSLSISNNPLYSFISIGDKDYLLALDTTTRNIYLVDIQNKKGNSSSYTVLTPIEIGDLNVSVIDESGELYIEKGKDGKYVFLSNTLPQSGDLYISDNGLILIDKRYLIGEKRVYDLQDASQTKFSFGYIKLKDSDHILVLIKKAPLDYKVVKDEGTVYYVQNKLLPFFNLPSFLK
jgi:hypothetical protein